MARRIEVEITGDSRQLERAFDRSAGAAASFNQTLKRNRRSVSTTFDPLLQDVRKMQREQERLGRREIALHKARVRRAQALRTTAFKVAGGAFAISRGFEAAAELTKQFDKETTPLGRHLVDVADGFSAITRLDPAGVIQVIGRRFQRTKEDTRRYVETLDTAREIQQEYGRAAKYSAERQWWLARRTREAADAAQKHMKATNRLRFQLRKYNTTVINGQKYIVPFKGSPDDRGAPRSATAIAGAAIPLPMGDVFLDGEKVGRVVARQADRKRTRSPKQKRGPNAGR